VPAAARQAGELRRGAPRWFALLVLAIVAGSAQGWSAPATPCAQANSTLAMTECLSDEIRRAEAILERYRSTAQRRLAEEQASQAMHEIRRPGTGEIIDLAASQRLWLAYRRAHCGSIAARWQGASIQPIQAGECMLRLTRQRTHELWRAFLTFQDSTPPLLPEPSQALQHP
jgi:uncharacterized protein YecT (DUF1311 family)